MTTVSSFFYIIIEIYHVENKKDTLYFEFMLDRKFLIFIFKLFLKSF